MYGLGGESVEKKGMNPVAIRRIRRLYTGGITIPVVNNILGEAINNNRRTLRQGDCPSSIWFAYGIDPMLIYLEKRLIGILIYSAPVSGPSLNGEPHPLPQAETRYKVVGYCDDCKPAVTTMSEFFLIDKAAALFEKSSGCRLHRDPTSDKCKFLPLGRWNVTLQQEDIPLSYLKVSPHLDMLSTSELGRLMVT